MPTGPGANGGAVLHAPTPTVKPLFPHPEKFFRRGVERRFPGRENAATSENYGLVFVRWPDVAADTDKQHHIGFPGRE